MKDLHDLKKPFKIQNKFSQMGTLMDFCEKNLENSQISMFHVRNF